MGHAVCAYLSDFLELTSIYEAIAVPEIRIIIQNAMLESALALPKRYDASLADLQLHISDLPADWCGQTGHGAGCDASLHGCRSNGRSETISGGAEPAADNRRDIPDSGGRLLPECRRSNNCADSEKLQAPAGWVYITIASVDSGCSKM